MIRHIPTMDESTWAWWCLMWALEGKTIFKKKVGMSSGNDNVLPENYLRQLNCNNIPTGTVLHQNTCGHGYTPRESYHMADRTDLPPNTSMGGVFRYDHGSRTLLGASPAEIAFRGYSDRQKRWSPK